jgi:hypothetical protein
LARLRAESGWPTMPLHLHGNDLHGAGDERQSVTARVIGNLRAAMSAIDRSIAAAVRRLVPGEPTFCGDGGEPSPQYDPTRYPHWPLILDEKWDF